LTEWALSAPAARHSRHEPDTGRDPQGSPAGRALELPDDIQDAARSPLEAVIMRERLERFLDALQRLRNGDRQIIVWRIELGYSYEEIAQKLGKSTPATRMKVARAISRLAKEMGVAP